MRSKLRLRFLTLFETAIVNPATIMRAPGLKSKKCSLIKRASHLFTRYAVTHCRYNFKKLCPGQVSIAIQLMWAEPLNEEDEDLTELVRIKMVRIYTTDV